MRRFHHYFQRQLRLISFFGLVSLCLLKANISYAGHILGGELYWTCINSGVNQGMFIFHAKMYRICYNGISILPNTFVITNPLAAFGGPANINCIATTTRDISPKCYNPVAVLCGQSPPDPFDKYAVEEVHYESAPVQINGTPPATGAVFSKAECCRSVTQNSNSFAGFYFRSVMFPVLDEKTCQPLPLGSGSTPRCYDSSPRYAQALDYLGGLDKENVWRNPAFDPDGDQLIHSLTAPLETATQPMSYKSGFNALSPLPDATFFSSNKKLEVDSFTGYSKATTFGTLGLYQVGIKVESYRSGQKVAEFYRDYPILLLPPNSDPAYSSNQPPTITFKKATSSTYVSTLHDTVNIGSPTHIQIKAVDLNFLTGTVAQSVSAQVDVVPVLGSPFNSAPCPFATCASLDVSNPQWNGTYFKDTSQVVMDFHWTPPCDLFQAVSGPPTVNGIYKTYAFRAHAFDNFCPLPLQSFATFYVTVRDTTEDVYGFTDVVFVDSMTSLTWRPPMYAAFSSYELYRKSSATGTYAILATISNKMDTTFLDSNGLANHTSKYYALRLTPVNACLNAREEVLSLVLSTSVTANIGTLSWNQMYRPFQSVVTGDYYVEADSGNGWKVRDTIQNSCLSLTWKDTVSSCIEKIYYRIRAMDFRNNIHYLSNVDSLTYFEPYKKMEYTICGNDSILLAGSYRQTAGSYFDSVYTVNECKEITEHVLYNWDAYPNILYHDEFCKGDSILIRSDYYKEPGIYQYHDVTKDGCDSISYYSLSYIPVDDSIINEGNKLRAHATGAIYQWIDCQNNAPIPGATSSIFQPVGPGKYAVVVGQNDCKDTSECIDFIPNQIATWNEQMLIRLFPNPARDYFILDSEGDDVAIGNVMVYDVYGQLVHQIFENGSTVRIETQSWVAGLFFVKVNRGGVEMIFKLLIEE